MIPLTARPNAVCPTDGCSTCVDMCERSPCWPTPEEAVRLIEEGYEDRLMVDRWLGTGKDVYILTPAAVGAENGVAQDSGGRCTFLTEEGKCALHDLGLKPIEGRLADCQNADVNKDLTSLVGRTWDNPVGQALIQEFEQLRDVSRYEIPRRRIVVTLPDQQRVAFPTSRWHRQWEPAKQPLQNFLTILSEVDPVAGRDRKVLAIFQQWVSFQVVEVDETQKETK